MTRTQTLLLVALFALSLAACDRVSQSALDLSVGDCFIEPDTTDQVSDVQRAPCNESHTGEVLLVEDYQAQDAYPGEDTFVAYLDDHCTGEVFTTYTGVTYDESPDIGVAYLYPTPDGWKQGDHEMTCYLVPVDKQPITRSYRVGAASPAPS